MTIKQAWPFFAAQTYCVVADGCGNVMGLYILHPNSIGRCGRHIGEKLVLDCLAQAKRHGFGILPFNAVVENNLHARRLYERLGFRQLGVISGGFRMKDGHYEDICPYYREV